MNRIKLLPLCTLLALSVFTLTACDSGSDSDASPQEDLTAMFADMQSALSMAFAASKTEMPDLNCPQGGTLGVTINSATGSGFNQDLVYKKCNGISGQLNLRGASAVSGQQVTLNVTMNGSLEKQCDLSINNFRQSIKTNFQNPQSATVTLNGSMSAKCSGGSTTCSFNNVTYNASSGATTFAGNCN